MKLRAYFADRIVPLAICAMAVMFALLVLKVHGVVQDVIIFVGAILIGAGVAAVLFDWLHRRRFYQLLSDAIDALDGESYLATELLERPSFIEGALFFDAFDHASRAMRKQVAAVRRAQREHREYVEMWVHEIKTPLAAARLIAHNNPSEAMDALDSEIDAVNNYVEQALYYARSTSFDRDFQIRQVRLDDVVRDALRHHARTLIGAHITPELDALDVTVRADAKWLSFVLGQLLVNAAKYRSLEEGPGHVRLYATRHVTGLDTATTVLTIADDGIGIPASDIDRVFDKGFTGENGRRFAPSTGIGLYLVRELCTKMGVKVWLESEPGTGTAVHLAFSDMTMLSAQEPAQLANIQEPV